MEFAFLKLEAHQRHLARYLSLGKDQSFLKIKTSVGNLPSLQVGSVWENKTKIHTVGGEIENFAVVGIPPYQQQSVELTGKDEEGDFLIPFARYSIPAGFRSSRCILLRTSCGGREIQILIPTFVCIRYFFSGGSTKFLPWIFNTFLSGDTNPFYVPSESGFDPVTKVATVVYEKAMSGVDVPNLAWIVASPEVRRCALEVSASLNRVFSKSTNSPAFPNTFFPALGEVKDLKVRGLWCKNDPRKISRFLALEIISVTLPRLFNRILYRPKHDNRKAELVPDYEVINGTPRKHAPELDESATVTVRSSIKATTDQDILDIPEDGLASAFGLSEDIPMELIPKEEQKSIRSNNFQPAGDFSGEVVDQICPQSGEGGTNSKRSTRGKSDLPIETPKVWNQKIMDIYEALSRSKQAEWLCIGRSNMCQKFSFFSPDRKAEWGAKSGWRWVTSESGSKRLRSFTVMEITNEGKYSYLIDIETRTTRTFCMALIYSKIRTTRLTEISISSIMESCAECDGSWSRVEVPGDLTLKPLRHIEKKTPQSYIEIITRA